MGKLVRDLIPGIIRAEGRTAAIRRLDDSEFRQALLDTLLEETTELRAAPPDERLNEAADVLEVVLAILALDGYDTADLARAAAEKRERRGGFEQRSWWDPEG